MYTANEQTMICIASRFVNSTNKNIFLTGKAGTGKTTFLKSISQHTHKNVVIAAPTGIAAINAGGVTLHSLFHLPFGAFVPSNDPVGGSIATEINTPQSLIKSIQMNKYKRNMIKEMELLIIDEVSMLRADLLDAIDLVLKYIRRQRNKPFGGVQVLFIGDLMQLPPVAKEDEWQYLERFYPSPFFFNAHVLQQDKPVYIELDKIYRQTDQYFIELLNRLRNNCITAHDVEKLNTYCSPGFKPESDDGYVFLTTHNYKADKINKNALGKLPGKAYAYEATIEGDFPEYLYPVDLVQRFKKDAQVMFIKNDYSGEKRYFNGKIGKIKSLDNDSIEVEFNDGTPNTFVEPYKWENKRFSLDKETKEIKEIIKGTFSHYPIKLAWAITVHKSQGLTFEKAIIDVSQAFAQGQVYVALSRLVSMDGLVLNAPIPVNSLKTDDELLSFTKNKASYNQLEDKLKDESAKFIRDFVLQCFNFNTLSYGVMNHFETYNKDESRSAKQQYKSWAMELQQSIKPLKDIGDKFMKEVTAITASNVYSLEKLKQRVGAAKQYFTPLFKERSETVFNHIKSIKGTSGTKKYKKELKELEGLFFKHLQNIYKAEALISAVIEQKDLPVSDLEGSDLYKDRHEMIEKEHKAPKKKKSDTKKISYDMFVNGQDIEEIATERNLAISTIEGHLAHYVREGVLDVSQFVDPYKASCIIKASEKLETTNLSPIKQVLGDEFTYSDLRFVMASLKAQKQDV
jgi:GTPase SAR1 family protein